MPLEQVGYSLKWTTFQSHIISVFESLLETEDLADVTLTCEGENIKAHKFMLSACSPYFRNVFKENPCSHPIVILRDVMYKDIVAILNFMYQGEAKVEIEQLPIFLQTAELLQVSGLRDIEYIKTNGTIDTAKRLKLPRKQTERDYFEIVCVDDVTKTEIEDENYDLNENVDVGLQQMDITYEKTGHQSLLEAALEVRNSPSILERSLTYDKDCTSSTEPQTYAPPDENMSTLNSGEYSTDMDNSPSQPHHSSQCGNCPHCGKIYSNQSALKYHVRLIHSDLLNLYCCHLCPQTFGFREGYKKHMSDVHKIRA